MVDYGNITDFTGWNEDEKQEYKNEQNGMRKATIGKRIMDRIGSVSGSLNQVPNENSGFGQFAKNNRDNINAGTTVLNGYNMTNYESTTNNPGLANEEAQHQSAMALVGKSGTIGSVIAAGSAIGDAAFSSTRKKTERTDENGNFIHQGDYEAGAAAGSMLDPLRSNLANMNDPDQSFGDKVGGLLLPGLGVKNRGKNIEKRAKEEADKKREIEFQSALSAARLNSEYIPGYADGGTPGGDIVGPGTGKSDSIITDVDKDGFIVPVEGVPLAKQLRAQHLSNKGEPFEKDEGGNTTTVRVSDGEHYFNAEEKMTLRKIYGPGIFQKLAPKAKTPIMENGRFAKGSKDVLTREELEAYAQSPYVQRYLDFLSALESPKGAKKLTGQTEIDNNKDGKPDSSAKGKFQFTVDTRNDIDTTYGVDAYKEDEHEQNLAAIALMHKEGALDNIAEGNYNDADKQLNKRWPSLPGGSQTSPGLKPAMERRQGDINLLRSNQTSTAIKGITPAATPALAKQAPIIAKINSQVNPSTGNDDIDALNKQLSDQEAKIDAAIKKADADANAEGASLKDKRIAAEMKLRLNQAKQKLGKAISEARMNMDIASGKKVWNKSALAPKLVDTNDKNAGTASDKQKFEALKVAKQKIAEATKIQQEEVEPMSDPSNYVASDSHYTLDPVHYSPRKGAASAKETKALNDKVAKITPSNDPNYKSLLDKNNVYNQLGSPDDERPGSLLQKEQLAKGFTTMTGKSTNTLPETENTTPLALRETAKTGYVDTVPGKEEPPRGLKARDILAAGQIGMGLATIYGSKAPEFKESPELRERYNDSVATEDFMMQQAGQGFNANEWANLKDGLELTRRTSLADVRSSYGTDTNATLAAGNMGTIAKNRALVEAAAADANLRTQKLQSALTSRGRTDQLAGALAQEKNLHYTSEMQDFNNRQQAGSAFLSSGIANMIEGESYDDFVKRMNL